jgi:SAM-dependent methyltransferase
MKLSDLAARLLSIGTAKLFPRPSPQEVSAINTQPDAPASEAEGAKDVPDDPAAEASTPAEAVEALPPYTPLKAGEKIRIVFLVLNPQLWPSFEPIWRRASGDQRFHCKIVVVPPASADMALEAHVRASAMLQAAGSPFVEHRLFSLAEYEPHVVFYPSPYGEFYPSGYKPEEVRRRGGRVAYLPYGLEVGGGVFNTRYQFDTEAPRNAWRVFARSPAQLASYSRYCSSGSAHVSVTGHPRGEGAPEGIAADDTRILEKAAGRPVILWTPHFSVATPRKWSSFLDNHEQIVAEMDARPHMFFVLRPHPFFFSRLSALPDWGPERARDWLDSVNRRENAMIDEAADYRVAFSASSAILADAGSFLVEYLLTGKPICYLTGADDIGLTQEASELQCFYEGGDALTISGFLDRIEKREDPLAPARAAAADRYFGPHRSGASERILDEIAAAIDEPDFRARSSSPFSEAHERAYQYWRGAERTTLAPASYYEEQEAVLSALLDEHCGGRFAVDIGCGNGRFTEIIARYYSVVEGIDPGEKLIAEARARAQAAGIANISYKVERLEYPETLSTYDLVSCMGVLSGLIDDRAFVKATWLLRAGLRRDGLLLLKDSLSLTGPQYIEWNDYTAVYRNIDAYLDAFASVGLSLEHTRELARDEEKQRVNKLFLFRLRD